MRSFVHRLEVKFVLIATIVIVLGATVINYILYKYERNEHYEMARIRAELVASLFSDVIMNRLSDSETFSDPDVQMSIADLLEQMSRREKNYVRGAEVFDANLRPVFVYGDSAYLKGVSLEQARSAFRRDTLIVLDAFYRNEKVIETYEPVQSNQGNMGVVLLIVSSEIEKSGLHKLASSLIVITIVVVVFSVLMAIVVARMLARPIKILAHEMELVESPRYETSLKKSRRDELGILQEQFLVMLDRLKKSEIENEKARTALIQAEKMASVGALASGIAHEINNPLAGLKQSIHRIMASPENIEQTRKYVSMIDNALVHIENVVKGLLDFSRKRELSLKKTNINDVLDDAVRMLDYQIKKGNIQCKKQLANDLPDVTGDAYYLEQVFLNLLLNAIDAMPGGGELTLRSFSTDTHAVVEIEDTGLGIEEDQIDQVFDPFFTTKEEGKGTGLGLPICYSIMKEHGGEIVVESKVGAGTKVAITIPHA